MNKKLDPEHSRGRTTLFGREPNAGAGKPSNPHRLPTIVAPEMSKSFSTIDCIKLGAKPVSGAQTFDQTTCFYRTPEVYVYGAPPSSSVAKNTWRPTDRATIALASDRPAGTVAPDPWSKWR